MTGSGSPGPVGGYTLSLGLADPKVVRTKPVTPSVRGHATVALSGGPTSQVRVKAWLDNDGKAHGTVVWTLSGRGQRGGAAGYPWVLQVDKLQISGNTAYVEAVVVRSRQSPGDVGTRVGFWVVDGGSGAGTTDYLALAPADPSSWWYNLQPTGGNFTIRS